MTSFFTPSREELVKQVASFLKLSPATVDEAIKQTAILRTEYSTGSFAELIDTFPEAIPAARRAARTRLKALKEAYKSVDTLRDLYSHDINQMHFKDQPGYIAYLEDLMLRLTTAYEREIKKSEYQLEFLANYGKPQKEKKGDPITPERIARARAFPIADLLEVKRTTTLCLWHDDHKPSMRVYPDQHVYCFVCGRRADSIDVYMALNGCSFGDAVRALAP